MNFDAKGEEALKVAHDYMRKTNTQGKVIFATVTGSQAYNVAQEGSDHDYKAVYFAPTEQCLGFDQPPESVCTHPNPDPTALDITLYEAKHFCKLVLDGDPFMLELVFTERYYYCTQEWRDFVKMRRDLLTRFAIQRHINYSKHQLERYVKTPKPIPGKRIYHIIRLLFAVDDMLAGCDISIWLEGERRELMLKIRRDGFPKEEFIAFATSRLDAASRKNEVATVPSDLREKIETWLIRTRCTFLRAKATTP